jgi:hypothetical protein
VDLLYLGGSARRMRAALNFFGADVGTRLEFEGYNFDHWIHFGGATFREALSFRRCVFNQGLTGHYAFFNGGPPIFWNCEFHEDVNLSYMHAERVSIGFDHCVFHTSCNLDGISAPLLFKECEFRSDLSISNADATMINLDHCSIGGELSVAGTRCQAFYSDYLKAPRISQIGPIEVMNYCKISHGRFDTRVRIEVKANQLDLAGTQMLQGGHVLVERANLLLNGLSSGAHLRISGVVGSTATPAILSSQDADAGSMSFAHLDMSRCIFCGANDVAEAIVEATVSFAISPHFWRTKRKCVADEFAWRCNASALYGWGWRLPGSVLTSEEQRKPGRENDVLLPSLRASQVAAVYRDLRSSFEARSDRPGAADFYYGEMEMRRHSDESGVAERSIITMYWLLSGYGLRAWRSFAWLFTLVIGGGIAMARWGLVDGPVPSRVGILLSVRTMIPALHRNVELTRAGSILEIAMTLLGPVLLALAILALRGRVKR